MFSQGELMVNIMEQVDQLSSRKIIHIDMDCFYAAIEIRDNPVLADRPVAVGSPSHRRGVICTANYIARRYGVRSAMPTATATRLCPDLKLLPVNIQKYKEVAERIHAIFTNYTDLVEPLSLDEAYLDVTNIKDCQGSATLLAQMIRQRILTAEKLTASAGIAPNKFLAKIASGWNKPNGIFTIRPADIKHFIAELSVNELFGVGKVTAHKLQQMGIKTCVDLQRLPLKNLVENFGKFGQSLYKQCRGIDDCEVNPNRIRKSLSVEETFPNDIYDYDDCQDIIEKLYEQLTARVMQAAPNIPLANQYLKIKFNNFKLCTAEVMSKEINLTHFFTLYRSIIARQQRPIRLLGLGVHFDHKNAESRQLQQSLF